MPEMLTVAHPAELFRNRKHILAALRDWQKIPELLAGTWPLPIEPPIQGSPAEAAAWLREAAREPFLVIDTEYREATPPSQSILTLVGVGRPDRQVLVARPSALVGAALAEVAEQTTLVFHHALADLPVLAGNLGFPLDPWPRLEDTMQAHGVLWSEQPHDLGFLQRIYGRTVPTKGLRGVDLVRYNQGDVLATLDAWMALCTELQEDPESLDRYRVRLALLPMLYEAHERGLAVDQDFATSTRDRLTAERDQIDQRTQARAGWPINLASERHVKRWCYTLMAYPMQRHAKTKRPTTDDDALAALAQRYPEDPVIAGRLAFAKVNQLLTHYVEPFCP